MKLLDRTWPTPAENLACDEALLDACEEGQIQPTLRFWEPTGYFVALGYASRVDHEVNPSACQRLDVPILRRCSGGGTVLQGPGCLNYALILPCPTASPLENIPATNAFVMEQHRQTVASLLQQPVQIQGVTDLTRNNLKFSGNAQRRKKHFLLFHGCFLLSLNLQLMEQILPPPQREPAYRQRRSHARFLAPLPMAAPLLKDALQRAWQAHTPLSTIPTVRLDALVREKYSRPEWNQRR